MKKRTKYTLGITSILLAGTLGMGAVAFAGDEDGTGGRRNRPTLTDEQKCEYQDEFVERASAAQDRIADRVTTLTEKQAAAAAAGETEKVAKIDKRLARLAKLSDRIETRLATFETWATENCA